MNNLDSRVGDLKTYFGEKEIIMKYRQFTWENQRFEFLLGKIKNCPLGAKTFCYDEYQCDECADQYLNVFANGVNIVSFYGKYWSTLAGDGERELPPLEFTFRGGEDEMIYLVCMIGWFAEYDRENWDSQKSYDEVGKLINGTRLWDGHYRYWDIHLAPDYRLYTEYDKHLDDFEKRTKG